MKSRTVKEVMVPLAQYATVPENATMFEAIIALEKAQQEFNQSQYRHRAILVYDNNKQIVGKVSQLDILKALEPKYEQIEDTKSISRLGYSRQFLKKMMDQFNLWNKPLDDICKKAGSTKVKDFMYTPTEGEYIEESATLDQGIHQLIVGHHQSLLVTREKEIVGILRVTDVFHEICTTIKTCEI
ncbi:MAG: CBS domain-containing protein [Desulfobacterales bacterium]|nr:CBS domain-containing protein [Desulfobacterales bacterium]